MDEAMALVSVALGWRESSQTLELTARLWNLQTSKDCGVQHRGSTGHGIAEG